MDVLTLSRLQFAVTSMFHFIFVPLTLGLSVLVAWMEWRYVKTGDETWLRMARFWGRLFLINFALGIVTGITMEFQFGMNWAEYSKYVGDIFGAPLAIEATLAFFLESVFIGVWIFGWNRVSKKMHAFAITLVAFATNLSALWILLANGWMQNPVGARIANITGNPLITQRAEMADFMAVLTNSYGWIKFFHTVLSGYLVAAFFVTGVAAWHLLRKNETELFRRSFKGAAVFGLVSGLLVMMTGDFHGVEIAKVQPAKLAAMEAIWDTQKGAPLSVFVMPDSANEGNALEFVTIPKLGSLLAYRDPDAEIKGLKDFPRELRPPVEPTFYSFRLMVGMGMLMFLLSMVGVYLSFRGRLDAAPWFLKLMIPAIGLPYIAGQLGWIVAEVGRQPWIVYGMLKTSDAVSRSVDVTQVLVSLIAFTLLYGSLGVVDVYLLAKYARKGPEKAAGEADAPEALGGVV
ncbi:MAG TPA: cytochrome ubiquinol oxidase subunit I [Deltaproteobacteria bacterium]|jgi:cytochrome d ubiquinol oxidase subunit I|nr:cytochrome ubiquinol oxidase subunit I [Deltaproteobacteria bacterium]HOI07564.1 cytochrome ubiquinol oxidase subunit I [Deltaproteobacteria bacterium]